MSAAATARLLLKLFTTTAGGGQTPTALMPLKTKAFGTMIGMPAWNYYAAGGGPYQHVKI